MTDVFTQNNQQTPASNQPASNSDYSDLLGLIRNEDGAQKYSSVPKALEALVHAQGYIPAIKNENETLKAQLAELQGKVKSQETLEEMVGRLATQNGVPRESDQTVAGGLTEEAVAKLLDQTLANREAQARVNENRKMVSEALTKKFGDKVQDALESKAKELGMTRQALGEIAQQHPQAVLQWFNTSTEKGATPTTTSFQTQLSHVPDEEIKRPEKSLLSGATHKEQIEFMRKIRAASEKKWGITS